MIEALRLVPLATAPRFASMLVTAVAAAVAIEGVRPSVVRANPEIKDYEIARFVYLKTNCGMRELQRLNPGGRPLQFHVECNNVSNWPGGMDIACAEPDDDRTCRVTTQERHFKYLDLLRQRE